MSFSWCLLLNGFWWWWKFDQRFRSFQKESQNLFYFLRKTWQSHFNTLSFFVRQLEFNSFRYFHSTFFTQMSDGFDSRNSELFLNFTTFKTDLFLFGREFFRKHSFVCSSDFIDPILFVFTEFLWVLWLISVFHFDWFNFLMNTFFYYQLHQLQHLL